MTAAEYNQCVDLHADGLYRFILKNLRDEDDASDVVQDTFEKMWLKHREIEGSKAKSYLFTAGYHTMIDKIRRDKKQSPMEEADYNMHSYSDHYNGLKEVLNTAVSQLPDIQRAVVLLRDYEGYSYEEIGEICTLTESQVKVYIYRARTFLKNYIGKMEHVI